MAVGLVGVWLGALEWSLRGTREVKNRVDCNTEPQEPQLDLTWWSDCDIRTSFVSKNESTMTLTPSESKQKQKTVKGLGIPTDWHICAINQPSPESLNKLKLPFETTPELKDTVPTEFTMNIYHLVGGQMILVQLKSTGTTEWRMALFTSYYACYNGALLAVSNIYRVWFKSISEKERFTNAIN